MSLSTFLGEYYTESEDIASEEVGAEEFTVITDETAAELDEIVADAAEEVQGAKDYTEVVDKLVGAEESLESKVALLRGMRERGVNLNAHAAKMYSQAVVASLEARGFPIAIYGDEVTEMEASFEAERAYDYTTEAEEKTEGLLSKIRTTIAKVIEAFVRWVKNQWAKFTGWGRSSATLAEKLSAAAEKLPASATLSPDVKLSSGGLTHIVVDSSSDALEALKASASAMGEVSRLNNDFVSRIQSLTTREVSTKGPWDSIKVDVGGGWELRHEKDNMKIDMFATNRRSNKDGVEISPLSRADVIELAKLMKTNAANLDKWSGSADKIASAAQKAVDNLAKEIGKMDKGENKDDLKTANKTLNANVSEMLAMFRQLNTLYSAHCVAQIKEAYRLGYLSINAHNKAKEESK